MLNQHTQIDEATGLDSVLSGFQALAEELEMDDEIRNDLLRSFLDRCRGFLEGLKQSVETDDTDLFERTTHSLKGLSGNMRFAELNQANENFTDAVKQGDAVAAQIALQTMHQEYIKLEKAILSLID